MYPMKLSNTTLYTALLALLVGVGQSTAAPLVFSTTFDDETFPDQRGRQGHHWELSDYLYDYRGPANTPGYPNKTGVGLAGGWFTALGGRGNNPTGDDAIIAAANHPRGGGGKGFRHWRGNGGTGQNDNGGGISIEFAPLNEFWFRMYMRYQSGFTWGPNGVAHPHYSKDLRNLSPRGWTFGIQGAASWGIHDPSAGAITSSKTWQSTMGGMKGDGKWHCYEIHWKNGPGSRIEMWIDNEQVLDKIVNTSTDPTSSILVGSNQNAVGDSNGLSANNGGTPTDWYTDYDDIAISATGRIGC